MKRSRVFWWGGIVSGGVLIAFGIVVIVLAFGGQHTVIGFIVLAVAALGRPGGKAAVEQVQASPAV